MPRTPVKKITAYLCGTDYYHEIGECTTHTFASVKALKQNNKCWRECGIVKVEVRLVKWMTKPLSEKQKWIEARKRIAKTAKATGSSSSSLPRAPGRVTARTGKSIASQSMPPAIKRKKNRST